MTLFCLGSFAQETTTKKSIPLHFEASLEGNRGTKEMMAFGPKIDLNYCFAQRLTLHAVAQYNCFLPKNGEVKDQNQTFNLGGGLSFVLFPEQDDGLGIFELRALATAGVSGDAYKHTAYEFGMCWYLHNKKHFIQPVIGVGYKMYDFSGSGHSTFHSGFVSFGIRF